MATRKYGFGNFLVDCLLVILTGGLWLFWLLFKFFRSNS